MTPETVKGYIRNGQSDTVFFIEAPGSLSEILPFVQLLIENPDGVIIIGVKECGTVVGLRKKEAEIKEYVINALLNTALKYHIIQLISEFKVLVISK